MDWNGSAEILSVNIVQTSITNTSHTVTDGFAFDILIVLTWDILYRSSRFMWWEGSAYFEFSTFQQEASMLRLRISPWCVL